MANDLQPRRAENRGEAFFSIHFEAQQGSNESGI
jgi:hypothetical protein